MNTLFLAVCSIILVFASGFFMIKLGNEGFSPKNVLVDVKTSDNILTFESERFTGKYELTLPKDISINENDKVYISYNYNLGKLTSLNEIYVPNKFKISGHDINSLNLKMLLK